MESEGMVPARVKRVNVGGNGYGFLTRGKGTPDIFVHASLLKSRGIAALFPNQAVLVRFVTRDRGDIAIDIRADDPPIRCVVHGHASCPANIEAACVCRTMPSGLYEDLARTR